MRVPNIVAEAARLGLTTIGFSDHIWTNEAVPASDWYKLQNATHIAKLRREIEESGAAPLRISVGCEADMRAPGEFSITPDFAATLDHVLLACSHFHMRGFVEQPADTTPRAIGEHLIKFFISGVSSGLPTSIAHPFFPLGSIDRLDAIIASIPDSELSDTLSHAAAHNVALEITTCFIPGSNEQGNPVFSLDTPLRLLSLAKQAGCKFTFGSDAHSLSRLHVLSQLEFYIQALALDYDDMVIGEVSG
jgi:histidinol phosphatase-like PHP family hydrolase